MAEGRQMGITVVLEDEGGRKLATIDDPTNVVNRLLLQDEASTTQMLRYIDWGAERCRGDSESQ